jgi:hypothetical protein
MRNADSKLTTGKSCTRWFPDERPKNLREESKSLAMAQLPKWPHFKLYSLGRSNSWAIGLEFDPAELDTLDDGKTGACTRIKQRRSCSIWGTAAQEMGRHR